MKSCVSDSFKSGLPLFLRALTFIFFAMLADSSSAQTNSWIQTGDGFWDDAVNWSLGLAPSSLQSLIAIDNAGTKTATIDRYTAAFNPSTLTVAGLSIDAPAGSTNTLLLDNVGLDNPLQTLTDLTIGP